MPLLVFPGGYGGMVHSDDGRVSISCCIRRDTLRGLARKSIRAAPAMRYSPMLPQSCQGGGACSWRRPNCRRRSCRPVPSGRVFAPVTAMASSPSATAPVRPIRSLPKASAWPCNRRGCLCRRLIAGTSTARARSRAIGAAYQRDWRRHFAFRINAAALFAQLALRPATHGVLRLLLRREPRLLTLAARLSGKTHRLDDSGSSIARSRQ